MKSPSAVDSASMRKYRGAVIRVAPLWLALFLACAGCHRQPALPAQPDLVLVVIDTLRADRLGTYGNPRGLTPFLDTLAEHGIVFRRAYAASSWTMPSVASLLTSRFPGQHGVNRITSILGAAEQTLPEALHEQGYATAFFSANGSIDAVHGFAQGFDRAEAFPNQEIGKATSRQLDASGAVEVPMRADHVNRAALGWLDERRPEKPAQPVFLYLQLMEPHHPYVPSRETLTRLREGRPYPDLSSVNGTMLTAPWLPMPVSDDHLRSIIDTYDAEVAAVDTELRELFRELAVRHLLDRSIVVITADHGEELSDHGSFSHGTSLYEEQIRVPLIVRLPGAAGRTVRDDPVSLVDLAPTLLALVGASIPTTFEGRPLLGLAADGIPGRAAGAAPHPVYSELLRPEDEKTTFAGEHRAVVVGAHKLLVGPDGDRRYYDLEADPTERAALWTLPDAGLLADALEHATTRTQRARAEPRTEPLDEAARARLRALGYVQ